MTRNSLKSTVFGMVSLLMLSGSGCTSTLFGYIPAIPVAQVPISMLGRPREDMQEITLSRLRQRPADVYRLDEGDVLGIYIQNVLDAGATDDVGLYRTGIPYRFPEDDTLPPYVGIPVPVHEGGKITLPLNTHLNVTGLTVTEVEDLLRQTYTIDRKVLKPGADTIAVTLQKKRTHEVIVIRQDTTQATGVITVIDKEAESNIITLPEGENDLLHALGETGGLPGLDAKNEVLILRSNGVDGREWDKVVAEILSYREPCTCPAPVPDAPNVIRIPLRFYPEQVPDFTEQDIILQTGDIVVIESRDKEKFYTGGTLDGGEHDIPRDYDLDILGAIALAGGSVGSTGAVLSQSGLGGGRGGGGGGGGSRSGGGPLPPTDAIIIRKLCDGSQISIRVDLKEVFDNPRQRILIQPEDVVIVRYKCIEEIANTALSLIQFNFLFNGLSGGGIR